MAVLGIHGTPSLESLLNIKEIHVWFMQEICVYILFSGWSHTLYVLHKSHIYDFPKLV